MVSQDMAVRCLRELLKALAFAFVAALASCGPCPPGESECPSGSTRCSSDNTAVQQCIGGEGCATRWAAEEKCEVEGARCVQMSEEEAECR